MAERERRSVALEVRSKGRRLEGYAALFDVEARIGPIREKIAPGAFAASLASGADILALADHDPARVLARTRSGSLRLSEDSRGLAFDLAIPETQAGRDILALAERSDLGGMSFGFQVPAGGEEWVGELRTIRAAELFEISVVSAWPAYEGTTITARSRQIALPPRLALASRYLEILGA
ncbi:MAG: HK97 family phage prohead protease [Salinarimonadaceae bacterium]|nr:MAG: HK97 family phage prohead protease [Salinarimonadaceae bacterium]